MSDHYSKEDLELYRNHQMSVLGQIACASHLKGCPTCAKLLEELKADDLLLHELRASVKIYDMLSKKEPHETDDHTEVKGVSER